MNKTKIDWPWQPLYTWNPLTGCERGCSYCYARKMAKRFGDDFAPKFHEERLYEPCKRKKPSNIFVCSMADLFGDWVDNGIITRVMDVIERCPQHTFILLTKSPTRYWEFWPWPKNAIFGATLTGTEKAFIKAGLIVEMDALARGGNRTFLSLEPLLGDLSNQDTRHHCLIVGPDTTRKAKTPDPAWVPKKFKNIYYKKGWVR